MNRLLDGQLTIAGASVILRPEHILGLAWVTLGDTDGFTFDDDLDESGGGQFAWFDEEERFHRLPWAEAIQRFGSPRRN